MLMLMIRRWADERMNRWAEANDADSYTYAYADADDEQMSI